LFTIVLGQPIGPISKGTDRLSWNVCQQLPIDTA